jgi:ribose transport system substrate-binding protein
MKNRGAAVWIALLLLFSGCSGSRETAGSEATGAQEQESRESFTIGISPLTLQLEYYVSYVQSMRKIAKDYNVELVIIDSLWNTNKQISDIRDMAVMRVDAVICSPTDPVKIQPHLLDLQEAGIPVVVEMTRVEGVYPLVGTDQKTGGRLAGEYAGRWLNEHSGGRGDVVILDFPYFQNIIDRVDGFIEGLSATAPEAEIYARVDTKAKYETASKAMEDLLEENPAIRCVFGINDDSAKGANAAYENTDIPPEEVCILGFDADQGATKLISAGRYLKGSVAADTDKIAETCLVTALQLINGEPVPDWVEVQDAQYLISQENVAGARPETD